MIVHLIRHGKTTANRKRLISGMSDVLLDAEGKEELEAYKEKGIYPPDVGFCYISGLKRTKETKDIIYPEAAYRKWSFLNEIDFGDYEGTAPDEHEDDRVYMAWLSHADESFAPPNGESFDQFQKKVAREFPKVLEDALGRGYPEIAVIGHGAYFAEVLFLFLKDRRPFRERIPANGRGISMRAEKQGERIVCTFLSFL